MLVFNPACALEKSIDAAADIARSTAVTLLEKSPPLTNLAAGVQASIDNPTYRIFAVVVNGVLLEVGLEGVQLEGNANTIASGDAGDALSPETVRLLAQSLAGADAADELLKQLTEALRDLGDRRPPDLPE
jgi:hypothetical protein